mmetsp:Transcript_59117/g.145085  ORF Transcript_59117/g.145085 Transcript_59117/m.145085 type:complete len:208 (-) Transcript_59117:1845-2468(-)
MSKPTRRRLLCRLRTHTSNPLSQALTLHTPSRWPTHTTRDKNTTSDVCPITCQPSLALAPNLAHIPQNTRPHQSHLEGSREAGGITKPSACDCPPPWLALAQRMPSACSWLERRVLARITCVSTGTSSVRHSWIAGSTAATPIRGISSWIAHEMKVVSHSAELSSVMLSPAQKSSFCVNVLAHASASVGAHTAHSAATRSTAYVASG